MELTYINHHWLGRIPTLKELRELTSCLLYSSCNMGGMKWDGNKKEMVPSTRNPHTKQEGHFTNYKDYTFINKTDGRQIEVIGLAESDPHDKQDDEFFVSKEGLYRNACDLHLDKDGLFPYRRICTSMTPEKHPIPIYSTTYEEIINYCKEDLEERIKRIKKSDNRGTIVDLMNDSYCRHIRSQLDNGRWKIRKDKEEAEIRSKSLPKIPLPLQG